MEWLCNTTNMNRTTVQQRVYLCIKKYCQSSPEVRYQYICKSTYTDYKNATLFDSEDCIKIKSSNKEILYLEKSVIREKFSFMPKILNLYYDAKKNIDYKFIELDRNALKKHMAPCWSLFTVISSMLS